MNLLTLLAAWTFTATLPTMTADFPPRPIEGPIFVEWMAATIDSAERFLPTSDHGPFAPGSVITGTVEIPADGLSRRVRLYASAGDAPNALPSNGVLVLAWASAPDTLIVSTAGRSSRTLGDSSHVEWKRSVGRRVSFAYDGPGDQVDAWAGAPFWLANVRQAATWEPVHADLCRLYGGWVRNGALVRDCQFAGMFFGSPRWR